MTKTLGSFLFVSFFILSHAKAEEEVRPFYDQEDLISISAVGDIMPGTNFPSAATLPENGGASLFRSAKAYLKSTDIVFGNFEGTLFDGPPQPDGKKNGPGRFVFRSPISYGHLLKDAGFNFLSLANNHSKDFGREGIESTKRTLDKLGIKFSSKDGEVATQLVKSTKVAMIAFDFFPGKRSILNFTESAREVTQVKSGQDIVIVSAHVGAEGDTAMIMPVGAERYLGENRGDSIQFAHNVIDAGADLVLMHGPHVPRGIELYKRKLIVYSLGNFATSSGISIQGYAGVAPLLRVAVNKQGDFARGHLASFIQKRPPSTVWDSDLTALKLIRSLSKKQFPNSSLLLQDNGFIVIDR